MQYAKLCSESYEATPGPEHLVAGGLVSGHLVPGGLVSGHLVPGGLVSGHLVQQYNYSSVLNLAVSPSRSERWLSYLSRLVWR